MHGTMNIKFMKVYLHQHGIYFDCPKRGKCCIIKTKDKYVAHLQQECHNSKFGFFELLVQKETFADDLLTGTHVVS